MGTQIIDAFIVTFGIQAEGYAKGEREIEVASRRLREDNKRTFDGMEQRGKSAAQTFKSVRNEVVGLGLAFLGANTVAGLISGMMTGAAVADRLGKTMGMNAKQVWSWRMAMKGVGGQATEADAALQTIQKAKMGWIMGGDTGNNLAYSRLGINAKDLQSNDPGAILKKISGMADKLDPQIFASLLQQIGMSGPMIYFLQQGKGTVDKLLGEYEKNSDGQEKLAKETEELQKTMSTLQATIMGKLVPPLVNIANVLNRWLGSNDSAAPGSTPAEPPSWRNGWGLFTVHRTGEARPGVPAQGGMGGIPFGGAVSALLGGVGAQPAGSSDPIMRYFTEKGLSHGQALGIRAGIHAEGGVERPVGGGYKGRAYGIGQWLGPRKAELFRRYGKNPGLAQQLEFMWWELNGGDHGGKQVLAKKDPHQVFETYIKAFMRPAAGAQTEGDMRRGSAFLANHARAKANSTVNIGTINIHTKAADAKGIARDLRGEMRRSAVSQADRGVAP